MTIADTGRAVSGSPTDLDLRRQLREAREETRALREQEAALREHLEALAGDLRVSEHLRVEMHVNYVELLARARAEVAEQRDGTPLRHRYLAGHLKEIGLEPPAGVSAEQVVAEGLALAVHLAGGPCQGPGPHSAVPHSAAPGPAADDGANASGRAPRRAGARESNDADRTPQPHISLVPDPASEAGSRDVMPDGGA